VAGWARSHRHLCLAGFDLVAWGCALALQAWARRDFDLVHDATAYWSLISVVFLVVAAWLGLHQGRAAVATLDETLLLGLTVLVSSAGGFALSLLVLRSQVPRSVPVTAAFLALVIMWWARALWRTIDEHARLSSSHDGAVPVLVLGAGEAGRQLVRSIITTPEAPWRPVALLDDDRAKRHLRLYGVPVRGSTRDIARLAAETGASTLVIAVPSMDAARLRAVSYDALGAGLSVKVLPGVAELLSNTVGIRDVRDLDLVDLLGRRQIETDIGSIAGYLCGKRVLITGAGGSIGSELCRQVRSWGPAELIMLDHDDSALHAVQLSLSGRALLDSPDVVLADIRDGDVIRRLFEERRPQVVFHAAALKHLPMLELHPGEAVKTNVWGTLNVLEAAVAVRVERFVNISTDKAAEPVSVLGYSKRLTERLTAYADLHAGEGAFLSVRFGNVLGSRGSVLTSFAAQIAAGGPITVTHPDVTRYFMTVQEAVQLVIQAGVIGTNGDALVLDMGEPVNIDRLARKLVQLSGRDIAIEYTGLRQGEKLSEVLYAPAEADRRPLHPLISHVSVPPLAPVAVRALNSSLRQEQLIAQLASECSAGFGPSPTVSSAAPAGVRVP
jgi:FlaA1/EpsC-like NDP-sugar epimerase